VIALNEAETIGPCLQELQRHLMQDGPGDVIVSDGGSTDGTREIASAAAPTIVASRGRANGLNAGAARATGDVLLFLHADTRLPTGALAHIRRALCDASTVGGRFRLRLDGKGLAFRTVETSINLRDRLLGGFTGDQAIFVRRSVFEQMEGYSPIPLMEDLDFARRLTRSGHVARLPQAVTTSARRWQSNGVLRTIFRMWTLRALYYAGVSPSILAPHYRDTR
jgi:rSAM/selenodomain-associated transferase 2